MLTVTGLAKQSGTTAHAVRYYTRRGLLHPVRDPDNGYQLYQPRDIGWLRFIRKAKALGFTLNDIEMIMHDADHDHSPCPRVREILQRQIVGNRQRLNAMVALQNRMEQALLEWADQPNGEPDGHSVCRLIDSFAATEHDQEHKNIVVVRH